MRSIISALSFGWKNRFSRSLCTMNSIIFRIVADLIFIFMMSDNCAFGGFVHWWDIWRLKVSPEDQIFRLR